MRAGDLCALTSPGWARPEPVCSSVFSSTSTWRGVRRQCLLACALLLAVSAASRHGGAYATTVPVFNSVPHIVEPGGSPYNTATVSIFADFNNDGFAGEGSRVLLVSSPGRGGSITAVNWARFQNRVSGYPSDQYAEPLTNCDLAPLNTHILPRRAFPKHRRPPCACRRRC